jgi:hypothetical protein
LFSERRKRNEQTIVAAMLALAMALTPCTVCGEPVAQAQGSADQQAMDQLLAPVALYPDALLAQTLACATSPDQVREVSEWLTKNNQLQGSDLQQAAEQAGFDASFIAIVLFPDVLKLLADNEQWTTELGKAFLSDQKAVLASAQRLRGQAKAAGNLKTTPEQEVKTETSGGQQVIVIQPANPQVVYVPQYDPQTAYTAPPPQQQQQQQQSSSGGNSAAAGLIGFTAGILLGAAVANNNDNYGYYGWGAWGCSWHTSAVVVRGGAWRVPPVPRYPYTRPVARGYRPPANVYAPRYSNVNVNRNVNRNVNVNNINVNRQNRTVNNTTNNLDRTPRPTTASSTRPTRPAQSTTGTRQPRDTAGTADHASRGRNPNSTSASPSPARQMESGARTSAFSGYQNGNAERQASARGSRSTDSSSSGGERRRRR